MELGSSKTNRIGYWVAAVAVALLAATSVSAQTVYKSTNPDGSVVYSDKPPAHGNVDKIIEFPDLPSSPVPPLAARRLDPAQMARTPPRQAPSSRVDTQSSAAEPARPPPPPVTLYSAMWCGYCRRAKAYLADHGIAYRNVDIDTADGRTAFANVGSGGTPLLMSGKKRVRGFRAEGYDAFFASR